jgi:hypothetical protein
MSCRWTGEGTAGLLDKRYNTKKLTYLGASVTSQGPCELKFSLHSDAQDTLAAPTVEYDPRVGKSLLESLGVYPFTVIRRCRTQSKMQMYLPRPNGD